MVDIKQFEQPYVSRHDSAEVQMRRRVVVLTAVTATLIIVAALGSVPAAGQGTKAAVSSATGGSVPRTSWGHPDLQGIWTTDEEIGIPVERPVDLGTKATLTDEEFAKRAAALKKKYSDNKE